jgi:hypothetical protein
MLCFKVTGMPEILKIRCVNKETAGNYMNHANRPIEKQFFISEGHLQINSETNKQGKHKKLYTSTPFLFTCCRTVTF